jgi:predicted Rossmann fold flavoprotein
MAQKQVLIIGGGAAGFFAAINCAEKYPDYKITILEKSSTLLSKVKISGGGRCNVTHACFEPKELVKYYPRGEKQLLGPFTRFNPTDTIKWFEERGVKIKREADGRMFPVTDSSQTIINCFLSEARRLGIAILTQSGVDKIMPPNQNNPWQVSTQSHGIMQADFIIVTSGSGGQIWKMLQQLGHTVVPAVPSLFTFNINDKRLKGLEGISMPKAEVSVIDTKLNTEGPLLITHWGLSGPAVLKLSAWGARQLAETNYHFKIKVNWLGKPLEEVKAFLTRFKNDSPKKNVAANALFNMPKRLWESMVAPANGNYADLSKTDINFIASALCESIYQVDKKSTFKEEFVTAGGVDLKEVDFKTMQSKKFNGLFFAGEVLDIDALTGGFNFQAAWTTAWIAANLGSI